VQRKKGRVTAEARTDRKRGLRKKRKGSKNVSSSFRKLKLNGGDEGSTKGGKSNRTKRNRQNERNAADPPFLHADELNSQLRKKGSGRYIGWAEKGGDEG